MDRRIYLLALSSFAFGTGAFGLVGLIEPMAADLAASPAAVGQIATALAVPVAVGAPFLAASFARVDRRSALVAGLLLYGAFCAACALAPDLPSLLGLRVGMGLAGALLGPISAAIASSLAPPERRQAALAVVFSGVALSLLVGGPSAVLVGSLFGWRGAFWYAAMLCVLIAIALRVTLPAVPGQPSAGLAALKAGLRPEILPLLLMTAFVFAASFSTVAYFGKIATAATGLHGAMLGALQISVGAGALLGLALAGALTARLTRPLALCFALAALTQVTYAGLAFAAWHGAWGTTLWVLAFLVGAAALFATVPIIQAKLVQRAGPLTPVALALNASAIFLGQGAGSAAGGLGLTAFGLIGTGVAGAVMASLGLVFALRESQAILPARA
jgi:DHA1 family inner membrane transport protein